MTSMPPHELQNSCFATTVHQRLTWRITMQQRKAATCLQGCGFKACCQVLSCKASWRVCSTMLTPGGISKQSLNQPSMSLLSSQVTGEGPCNRIACPQHIDPFFLLTTCRLCNTSSNCANISLHSCCLLSYKNVSCRSMHISSMPTSSLATSISISSNAWGFQV